MLNKKIVAAINLAISGFGFAGTMGPVCVPGNVSVPCALKQWDIGIQALYLKPTYAIAPDASLLQTDLENSLTLDAFDNIGRKWAMAFALEGSYHFSTGNDLSFDWTHYDTTRKREQLNFSQGTRFNQATLVFGQHVDFDQIKNARFYGGLQYANLHISRLHAVAFVPDVDAFHALPSPFITEINNRDFNGLGPVLGINFAYAIGSSGFSFTANTATSVLYGTSRANVNQSILGLVINHPYNTRKMVVPGLEEKLGLNYQTQFAQGTLTIDGGYQALNYFNVINRAQTDAAIISDFGLYGPYLGVRWLGVA